MPPSTSGVTVLPKVTTLSHVSVERYCEVYRRLKQRYGRHVMSIWPKESRRKIENGNEEKFRKFVYEDIAIAAYLIVLFERYSEVI